MALARAAEAIVFPVESEIRYKVSGFCSVKTNNPVDECVDMPVHDICVQLWRKVLGLFYPRFTQKNTQAGNKIHTHRGYLWITFRISTAEIRA